jgi:hypothetical protein
MIVSGQRFGMLTTVQPVIPQKPKGFWECRCDCGRLITVRVYKLVSKHTQSCGCRNQFGKYRHSPSIHRERASLAKAIQQYRDGARRRGYVWGLSDEQAETIFRQPCHYCGEPPSNVCVRQKCPPFYYSGIDRLDATQGYIPTNVVACCKQCNYAKGAMTHDEFCSWIYKSYWTLFGDNSERK